MIHRLILCVFCLAAAQFARAQEPLHVNVMLMPPYPNYVDELITLGDEAIITIQNMDFLSGYDVKLGLHVDGNNGITLSTRADALPLQPIQVGPGETVILTGTDLTTLYNNYGANDIDYTGITVEQIINDQSLPDGLYSMCVRAYGYFTNQPLSSPAPAGCAPPFAVLAVDPPIITLPTQNQSVTVIDPQFINFSWIPVTAVLPDLRYRIEIMEINEAMPNPYDAFAFPDFLFFQEEGLLSNLFLYGPEHPEMTEGTQYAVRVRAYREDGLLNINNNGYSDIVLFTYGDPITDGGGGGDSDDPGGPGDPGDPDPGDPIVLTHTYNLDGMGDQILDCGAGCNFNVSGSGTGTMTVGDMIDIGHFKMYVSAISGTGPYTGKGVIQPTDYFPVGIKVDFKDVRVNELKRVVEGAATAEIREDSWAKATWADMQAYGNAFNPGANTLEQAWALASDPNFYLETVQDAHQQIGTTLPFSFGNDNKRLQVAGMIFEADRASYALGYFEKLADDLHGERFLSFMGKDLCITPGGPALGPNEAVLELMQDVRYTFDGKTSLTFKASENGQNGTQLFFDCNGFVGINATGFARLDPSTIVPVDDQGEVLADTVVAPFSAVFHDWSDWLAVVDLANEANGASNFRYAELEGYDFRIDQAIVDHSISRNAPDMAFPDLYTGMKSDEWQGFYVKEFALILPKFIKSYDGEDQRANLIGTDILIDHGGFTGRIQAQNVLSEGEGNLGKWHLTIDELEVEIDQNDLRNAKLEGHLKVPILEDPLTYLADVEYTPSGGTSHTFMLETTGEYEIPIWVAEATFAPNSGVQVLVNNNVATVEAKFHGTISFAEALGDIDKNNLTDIEFTDLVVRNRKTPQGGYLSIGDIGTGLTTEKLVVAGFAATLDQIGWNEDNLGEAALVLGVGLSFLGEDGDIGGSTVFRIESDIEEYADSLSFLFDGAEISGIGITAELGAVNISGTVEYFKDDPKFGSGFDGSVDLAFLESISVHGNILFGSKGSGDDEFYYFYTYGLAILGNTPIPLATPLDIYGFGGGVYFNMEVDGEMDDPSKMGGTGVDAREVFVPKQGIAGLQASVVLGLTPSTHTFNVEATLTAEINFDSWGLNAIYFAGAGYFMQKIDEGDKEGAMVKAEVLIALDFDNMIFSTNASIEAKVPKNPPVLEITGEVSIYRSPEIWYIKAGVPLNPLTAEMDLGVLELGATSYIMTGENLPPPVLPAEVLEFFQIDNTTMGGAAANLGIGFAAGLHFDIDYEFKAVGTGFGLRVMAGADVSIMHWYAATCSDRTEFGVNKWYAMGQAYLLGEIDVTVLGIEVAAVGLGVQIEGGFPAPTGLEGILAGYVRVLGAQKRFSRKFRVGEICNMQPMDIDELIAAGYGGFEVDLDMIGVMTPQGATTGVSTTVQPTVEWLVQGGEAEEMAFGDGMGGIAIKEYKSELHVAWHREHEDGSWTLLDYLTDHDEAANVTTLTATGGDGGPGFLSGFVRYKVTATASVFEMIDGAWTPVIQDYGEHEGEQLVQKKVRFFTTGTNLTEISPVHVDYTFPYERQRFYPYQHLENGQFKFNMDHKPKFDDFKDCGFAFYAHFEPIEGGELQRVEVDVDHLLHIFYEMPDLMPSTVYSATILAEREISPEDLAAETTPHCKIQHPELQAALNSMIDPVSSGIEPGQDISPLLTNTGFNIQDFQLIGENGEVMEDKILQTKELYTLYFRTSMYPTVHAKLNATNVQDVENASYIVLVSGSPVTFKRYRISLSNGEGFDRYDILGHEMTEQAGITNGFLRARGAHRYNYNTLSGNPRNWYQNAFEGVYNIQVAGSGGTAGPGPGGSTQSEVQALLSGIQTQLSGLPDIVRMPPVNDPSAPAGIKHLKPLLSDIEVGLQEALIYYGTYSQPGFGNPFGSGLDLGSDSGSDSGTESGTESGADSGTGSGMYGGAITPPDFNAYDFGAGGSMAGNQNMPPPGGWSTIYDNEDTHLELDVNFDRNAFNARNTAISIVEQHPFLNIDLPSSLSEPYSHMPAGTYRLELMSTHNLPEVHSEATISKVLNVTFD